MRHFCPLALIEAPLASGMLAGTPWRALVLRSGATQRFAPPQLAAPVGTVDPALITAAANDDLLMAARAVEESVALFGHDTRAADALLDTGALMWRTTTTSLSLATTPRRLSLNLSLHLSSAALPTADQKSHRAKSSSNRAG